MIVNSNRWQGRLLGMILFFMPYACWSVVILNSTFQQSGFKPAEKLVKAPQFASLMFLEADDGTGSGAWIGNYQGHGYILTAGHLFPKGTKVSDYSYYSMDGTEYSGDKLFLHPYWNDSTDDRTGYDFAIVRLDEEVTDAGEQPALYDGDDENGRLLTFMGYGWRGAGLKGEDTSIDTHNRPAAAVGLIEHVEEAVDPLPKTGDAGSYLGIWLPREDGSIKNPLDDEGIIVPVSPLSGILGSGDSGGPAWIKLNSGWAIAGVNSNGNGNAAYGDISWFGRVSHVRDWIKKVVPSARFLK